MKSANTLFLALECELCHYRTGDQTSVMMQSKFPAISDEPLIIIFIVTNVCDRDRGDRV